MLRLLRAALLLVAVLAAGCGANSSSESTEGPLFRDVTETHLPTEALQGLTMDAMPADLDADGDLDLLLANEFRPNILLLNDGSGRFTDASGRLPSAEHDSEDVAIADFDGDGDLDAVVVTEDDQTNEYYLNDGSATFTDAGDRWPVDGTSNAVVAQDLTGDGAPDLIVGNNGQNRFLVNDGTGQFADDTAARLPQRDDVTQDVELGDVDGDGDLDLIVGNEDANRLLLNNGSGMFTDAPDGALPLRDAPEETREADFGDVDGDGDLDLFFANVRLFVDQANRQNRLLLNDGTGRFTDATADRFPTEDRSALDGDFVDLDANGDLDIVTSEVSFDGEQITSSAYRAWRNDGTGRFTDATAQVFPDSTVGRGLDSEAADYNGDERVDLFFASRGTVDRLLLHATDE